jgi:hypothetical protein
MLIIPPLIFEHLCGKLDKLTAEARRTETLEGSALGSSHKPQCASRIGFCPGICLATQRRFLGSKIQEFCIGSVANPSRKTGSAEAGARQNGVNCARAPSHAPRQNATWASTVATCAHRECRLSRELRVDGREPE